MKIRIQNRWAIHQRGWLVSISVKEEAGVVLWDDGTISTVELSNIIWIEDQS